MRLIDAMGEPQPRGELYKALLPECDFARFLKRQSVDDPIVIELIESFRREIAEKDELLQLLGRALEDAQNRND